MYTVTAVETVDGLCEKNLYVFQPELGMLKGITAKLHVTNRAAHKFCSPCPVPYALREVVEKQLVTLESEGVLTPVNYSQWAAPIECILKTDSTVRICEDYKVTINLWLEVDQYPLPEVDQYLLPKTQDLFKKLPGVRC
jgi:hypothetical protein